MHEISIAENIIKIVNESLAEYKDVLVESVKIKVGKLSNVLPDSLDFCYNTLKKEYSSLLNSDILIEETPLKIKCNKCNSFSNYCDLIFVCETCGSSEVEVISGNELIISEIKLQN